MLIVVDQGAIFCYILTYLILIKTTHEGQRVSNKREIRRIHS
jgi:hypothetical protein